MSTITQSLIDERDKLTSIQIGTILVCFFMNMLDGMDVLVISYTAPAISKSWGIGPETLGIVFSSGLLGMTLGTLFVAPYADRIGRKNMILLSAIIMSIGIYLTAWAGDVTQLVIYRFISGIGIGCMLASTAALTAEFTPLKSRNFWVSFVVAGYPVGAVLSGLAAAKVIPSEGWEKMYIYAGIASVIAIPLILFFLSESIDFYLKMQPGGALQKINKIIDRLGGDHLTSLPVKEESQLAIPIGKLLSGKYKKPTLQLWLALFMAFAALYFMTSWIPKLATDAGLSLELAIYAGTVFNLGAFFGIVTQGYFSSKYGLKKTIGIILILTAILMCCFGFFVGSDWILVVFGMLGFGIQGGFVGLYAFAARMYPSEFKTTGIGWSMGAGRMGAIFGPGLAGVLLGMGVTIGTSFLIYGIPALIAGIMTMRNTSEDVD
ncbi:MFS transporter [Jiulongibacter sp. NS-SX5]|uniref:MFS transporter n=1 Tax=Jiulongibacter sp. NS-SX5 TaxID=3463854 RepID=UPI004057E5A9